ncbi:MAG: hypothetical protein RR968_01655, partial [Vagococcus sp.]
MKKKETSNLLTKQPVLKNVSLIGTTMMISSSILVPGITVKAYAESANEAAEDKTISTEKEQTPGMT